jgi:hypothetical protein
MTTNISGNSFLTTNEILFINNHVFGKLLDSPHIKPIPQTLSLSFLSFLSLSSALSLPVLSLFSPLHPVDHRRRGRSCRRNTPDVAWTSDVDDQRRTKAPPGRRANQRRWFARRPGGAFVRRWSSPSLQATSGVFRRSSPATATAT